jgi:hypothetical protein
VLNLNLVYDFWDGDKPMTNGKVHYPNNFFWDINEFIFHYINSFVFYDKIITSANKISDVYENPDKKFYYFICHASMIISDLITDGKILTKEIYDCVKKCPNFNIVFHSHHESDTEYGFISLYRYIKDNRLNHTQFYIFNNNENLESYKKKYESEINVHSYNYLPVSVTSSLPNLGGNEFKENKKFLFMTFNKSPKIHRYALLSFLKKHNLLDDCNWSFIPSHKPNFLKNSYSDIFDVNEINDYVAEIDYFNKLKIKISEFESDHLTFDKSNNFTIKDPSRNLGLNPEFNFNYTESYINITTESAFLDVYNVIHITEKSFKPFFYYQIPIFVSTYNHVKTLRDRYNFDMFDDIIDHNYDNEPNQKKRFKMIRDEILRLSNIRDNVISFYKENRNRIEMNRNKILEIKNNNSDYIKFKNLL